jgi:hypothetical protein
MRIDSYLQKNLLNPIFFNLLEVLIPIHISIVQ